MNASETLRITALTAGGAGLARLDGKAVFVGSVCVGDCVRASITTDHGRYAEATLDEVLEAGPERVAPACPLAGRCGGCAWQHIRYEAQVAAKATLVREQLQRLARIDAPEMEVFPSPTPFGWRHKARVLRAKDGYGFRAASSHEIVPLTTCPVLTPALDGLLGRVHAFLAHYRLPVSEFSAGWADGNPGGVAYISCRESVERRFLARVLEEVEGLQGLVASINGERLVVGDATNRLAPTSPHADSLHAADAFWQGHGALNGLARRWLAERLAESPTHEVVELFSGSGNLSGVVLEAGARLTCLEGEGIAVRTARENLHGDVRFREGDALGELRRLVEGGEHADTVLLDPPRAGFKGGMPWIARLGATRVLYQSCDQGTFARDARALVDQGYTLSRLALFDFFPHTPHAETLALFRRA